MLQSLRIPKLVPLFSMKEKPRAELPLALVLQIILLFHKSMPSKWRELDSLAAQVYQALCCQDAWVPQSRGTSLSSEGTRPIVDVHISAHPFPWTFSACQPLCVLPICTWCFPQLVPNCLVSWIFYCNFLCLIYFKVAKCFHKERTVKLFRNEKDSKTPVSFVSVWGSAWYTLFFSSLRNACSSCSLYGVEML